VTHGLPARELNLAGSGHWAQHKKTPSMERAFSGVILAIDPHWRNRLGAEDSNPHIRIQSPLSYH
jgi:hypothetical protein